MAKQRSARKVFSDLCVELVRQAFLGLTRPFPLAFRSHVAARLARFAIPRLRKARDRIGANLGIAFPDMPQPQRDRIVAAFGDNLGRGVVELYAGRRLQPLAAQMAAAGSGLAALEAAQTEGKGAVLVSGHFGMTEAIRVALIDRGLTCATLYRPYNNPFYDRNFVRTYRQNGPVLPRNPSGTRAFLKTIRDGGLVLLLPDQAMQGSPELSFFGVPAHTTLAPAEVALKYKVPLIPVFARRTSSGLTFEVTFQAPIPHTDAATMMQAYNDALEQVVRAHPEQYFWLHRRWKRWDTAEVADGGAAPDLASKAPV